MQHQDQQLELPLIVVAGSGPSQLGRDWLAEIRLNWQSMFATCVEETLVDLLQRHKWIFQDDLGTTKGAEATPMSSLSSTSHAPYRSLAVKG